MTPRTGAKILHHRRFEVYIILLLLVLLIFLLSLSSLFSLLSIIIICTYHGKHLKKNKTMERSTMFVMAKSTINGPLSIVIC